MRRKDLLLVLLNKTFSLSGLAAQLGTKTQLLKDDLQHLQRSLVHTPYRLVVTPARCRQCGFSFGADKLHRPSRCPECKGHWLSEPEFSVLQQPTDDA